MTITVEIPEELADQLIAAGKDPARAALEAIRSNGRPHKAMVCPTKLTHYSNFGREPFSARRCL